jgi:hypothetical protein
MSLQPPSAVELAASAAKAAGPRFHRSLWQRLLAQPQTVASAAVLATLVLLILCGPLIGRLLGLDPAAVDLLSRFAPPSAAHLLGTDEAGRDLLLRLLEGGRVSLAIGVTIAICAAAIGTVIGLIAGYFGGRFDSYLMRFTDGIIAPLLLPLLIVLAAVDLESSAAAQSPNRRRRISARHHNLAGRLDYGGWRRRHLPPGARVCPRRAGAWRPPPAHHPDPHPAERDRADCRCDDTHGRRRYPWSPC